MWERRYLPTVESFIAAIDVWHKNLDRPHEPIRETIPIDIARDWKTWLCPLGHHLGGIGGPKAPHVFEIELRNSHRE